MAETLTLELVTPERMVLAKEVDSVVVPGGLGEFEVLPGHLSMLATMKVGELVAKTADGEEAFAVGAGFVEVLPNHVTVLADTAEGALEIDIERAREAAKRARDRLANVSHENQEQSFVFQSALERAQSRLEVVEHRKERKK